jgi:hypothetical protein
LFEALYGYPPYEGDTVAVYRMHVREGNLRAPPPDTLVPAWVSSEIVRGLAVDPQDRHPSMHVLLDHLETAIESPHLRFRIRRRIVVLGTAIFGIAGATALGWALGRQPAARALGSAAQRVESGMRAAARSAADAAHSLMPPAPAGIGTSTGGELSARASVESPDEVEKTKPESVAKPPAPAARRKPGVACYFSTDQRELLAHRRQHRAQLRVGEDCYVCSAAEPAIRESYTWPEDIACSRSRLYTCNSAPENCSASSPG